MGNLTDFANLLFIWLCLGAIQVLGAFGFARQRGRAAPMRRALFALLASGVVVAVAFAMLWYPLIAAPCLLVSGWLTFAAMALSMSAVQAGYAEVGLAALPHDRHQNGDPPSLPHDH